MEREDWRATYSPWGHRVKHDLVTQQEPTQKAGSDSFTANPNGRKNLTHSGWKD